MLVYASASLGLLGGLWFSPLVTAQFPPAPEGMTNIESKTNIGASISFKETSICETTPGTKGFSGYVHLPANETEGRTTNINTYFWFFQARENPQEAPLAVWLQGGPGVPSITAALGENGPCNLESDSKTTTNNPWSWNKKVNMLYIDQPVQVGFSYDSLINGTINQMNNPFSRSDWDFSSGLPETNETFYYGTFAAQNPKTAPSTTETSTKALWEFMQTWMREFPHMKPANNRFSVWSESYGGHYGPAIGEYFETQNQAIRAGQLACAIPMTLDSLGIINGCIDIARQMPSYPKMAFNNTYGIKRISEDQYSSMQDSWPECEAAIKQCRALYDASAVHDGSNKTVNTACLNANQICFTKMHDQYDATKYDKFDITKTIPNDSVPKWAAGYLNDATIQAALGVPMNFTGQSEAIAYNYNSTGDFVYGGGLESLERLLESGTKVSLIYGDADYQCNWYGGEAVSLALNATISNSFHQAGYANITTNDTYVGGVVRQAGNLSFSRVYNAGHEIPYYQPETAYKIFERVMFDRDVATGQICTHENPEYASKGMASVDGIMNVPDQQVPPKCYMWDVLETCTQEEKAMLRAGAAKVEDYVLVH